MNKPTRFYSDRQEKKVAKAVHGKQVPNSGSTPYQKGDVRTDMFLIECKTRTKPSNKFQIQKDWITKNKEEAFAMNLPYSAVALDFGDGEQFYIIEQKLFDYLLKQLREEE